MVILNKFQGQISQSETFKSLFNYCFLLVIKLSNNNQKRVGNNQERVKVVFNSKKAEEIHSITK